MGQSADRASDSTPSSNASIVISLFTTRLRKAATDNGFDLEQPSVDHWLPYMSTKSPLVIWLSGDDENHLFVAVSRSNVARELAAFGVQSRLALPADAVDAIEIRTFEVLHQFLRRAFQLSRTLPFELLHTFQVSTAALPKTTEAERLVVQRLGQDIYRRGLIEYWEGRCAVTGLDTIELLRASHCKPWADCADDAERLDVFNGFLLAPHLDAVFDRGFMTLSDNGAVVLSKYLSDAARNSLCLNGDLSVARLTNAHRSYLIWHRQRIFRQDASDNDGAVQSK